MDIQEKYDEYSSMIFQLQVIIDNLKLKDYKEDLEQILWKAEDEFKEIEEQRQQELEKEWEQEDRQENREYWKSQF